MADTKKCSKCGIDKPLADFRLKKTRGVYKPYYICKSCEKEYRDSIKEYTKEYGIKYRKANKDKIKKYHASYYIDNKDVINAKHKVYREENKEKEKERLSKYYQDNLEKERAKRTAYNRSHKEYRKQYYQDNKAEIVKYVRERRQNDSFYRLKDNTRKLIYHCLKKGGYGKNSRTYEILGTDYDTFYKHLLQTFAKNYGYEWGESEEVHIDHIIPISTAKTKDDVIRLCHYTNLQLLKAQDNMEKSDKLEWNLTRKD